MPLLLVLAGIELVDIAATLTTIGALILGIAVAVMMAKVLDVSIAGVRPFHGASVAIQNGIHDTMKAQLVQRQQTLTDLFTGLAASYRDLLTALPAITAGVNAALVKLVGSLTTADVGGKVSNVRTTANNALAKANAASKSIDALILTFPVSVAAIVDTKLAALRSHIDVSVQEAINFVTQRTAALQSEIDAANAAIVAAPPLPLPAPGVELPQWLKDINPVDLISGLAAVPVLATLIHTITSEAGLDSPECRAKNKAICGTDPLQWAGLLAGLAALGISFDLSDVVKLAAEGVGEAKSLLADAGKIPDDVVQSVGRTIGEVAAAIAA